MLLQNNDKTTVVDALLDEGSTQSYINEHIAKQLGLNLKNRQLKLNVNVLNGNVKSINTSEINLCLMDIEHKRSFQVNAFTVDSVTGNLPVIDWQKRKRSWDHLADLKFSCIESKRVDLLLGMDHPQFHVSLQEVEGRPGEPVARKTVLGWTCVGKISENVSPDFSFFL